MSLAQRLREIIGSEWGAQRKFAQRIGVSQTTIRRYLQGAQPPASILAKIVNASGVSYEWLVEGKGSQYGKPPGPTIQVTSITGWPSGEESGTEGVKRATSAGELRRSADAIAVPCPVLANAGVPIIPEEYLNKNSEKYYLFRRRFLYNMNPAGDWICVLLHAREAESMNPTLSPGDLLLVDRNLSPYMRTLRALMRLNGSIALLANPDDRGLFVKRIWMDQKGRLVAQSDNPEFPAVVFDLEEQQLNHLIVGRVVWRGHEL